MPVLDTKRSALRGSALRHRPINSGQASGSGPVPVKRRSRPDVYTTAAPIAPDDLELEEEFVPRKRSVAPAPSARARRRFHPLFFVGLGLVVMIALWMAIIQVVSWGKNEYNNLVYGNPRTFQIDAVVGQGDSAQHPSHFIAINLHGTVTILEFPSGDSSHVRLLASTTVMASNADQAVVTLRFVDVNQNGQPDMGITIDGVQSVLINSQGTF